MKRFVLLLVSMAVLAGSTGAGAEQLYTDPSADAGPGTDIVGITVKNDQSGLISIQVSATGLIFGNLGVAVFIDADKNQSTGHAGDEAWMYWSPPVGGAFFSCTSAGCSPANPASFSAQERHDDQAATPYTTEFLFNKSEFGNVAGFNFAVRGITIDPANIINFWDAAPNSGYFTYNLTAGEGRVSIVVGAVKVTPAAPKAGKAVTITAQSTRVETGVPLDGGTVRCTATYPPGKTLRSSGSVVGGKAVCTLKLPVATRGKTVRGVMTVAYKTATAAKPFSFRVR